MFNITTFRFVTPRSYTIFGFFIFVFLAPYLSAQQLSTPIVSALDGMAFYGETGGLDDEQREKADQVDTLSFTNGEFVSKSCLEFGFKASRYKSWKENNIIYFEVVTNSEDSGEIKWSGSLKNNRLNVVYHWMKSYWFGTINKSYWFEGERIDSQAP